MALTVNQQIYNTSELAPIGTVIECLADENRFYIVGPAEKRTDANIAKIIKAVTQFFDAQAKNEIPEEEAAKLDAVAKETGLDTYGLFFDPLEPNKDIKINYDFALNMGVLDFPSRTYFIKGDVVDKTDMNIKKMVLAASKFDALDKESMDYLNEVKRQTKLNLLYDNIKVHVYYR